MNSRRALAGLLAILPLAALLVVVTVLPPPDRVPTHWTTSRPDGWSSGEGFLAVIFSVVVITALVAAVAALLQRAVPQAWSRWAVTASAAVGWWAVVTYVVTVWRTGRDGADGVLQGWTVLEIVAGLLAGALVYVVHARVAPTEEELLALVPERSRVQPMRGGTVEQVQPWSTEVRSMTLAVTGWIVLVVLVVVAFGAWWAGESVALALLLLATGLGVGLLALAWSAVRLEADADGLRVRSTAVGVVVKRVPAAEIVGVHEQVLDPMEWGGIGLRALPDRTAYIVDGGPGIVIFMRDGRRLALQVTEGDEVARAGARTLLRAAGQALGDRAS